MRDFSLLLRTRGKRERGRAALPLCRGPDVHSEVGEFYSARSQIVHGTRIDDPRPLLRLRQHAVEIAVGRLEMLFLTHPALLTKAGAALVEAERADGAGAGAACA